MSVIDGCQKCALFDTTPLGSILVANLINYKHVNPSGSGLYPYNKPTIKSKLFAEDGSIAGYKNCDIGGQRCGTSVI
jgi:hypothetical protein